MRLLFATLVESCARRSLSHIDRGHQVSARMEVTMDKHLSRKETLCLIRRFEALHQGLAFGGAAIVAPRP